MTFPTQTKISAEDDQTKLSLMGRTAFTDPGTFFGLMSVSAAHRAIVTGRHSDSFLLPGCENRVLYDSDYYLMKARCIHEMNAKLKDPVLAISNEAFGTIINLLTSAVREPFRFPWTTVFDLSSIISALVLLPCLVHESDWSADDSWSLQ